MRNITTHMVEGDSVNHLSTIEVLDEPGQGGANHEYRIQFPDGQGARIYFQNGPIREFGVNGCTHEEFLAILIDRMEGFQAGQYACTQNEDALSHLRAALNLLQYRTRERIRRGVEGTHAK
jgi:hypothetical protein